MGAKSFSVYNSVNSSWILKWISPQNLFVNYELNEMSFIKIHESLLFQAKYIGALEWKPSR